MNKTRGWETTQAQMDGQFEQLTPGGHIVKILHAEVGKSKNEKEMLILSLDIAEGGEFDGIFRRAFDIRKRSGDGRTLPKWPNGGMFYQLTTDRDGNTNPRFKGLIKAIEESNMGYAWNWDERTLHGKLCGMIFREEEYPKSDGTIGTTVKPMAVCPAGEAFAKEAPKKKLLDANSFAAQPAASDNGGFTQVDDDELPF